MTTELLALDEISSSQAGKEITHNTALRQIEGRMIRAKDKDLTTPPASPANGDTYIIPSGATGVWSGKTNQIAHFFGGAWTYWTPIEGTRLWLNDEDLVYVFNGTAWVTLTVATAAQNANLVYAGPTSGAAAAPAFRALIPLDLPVLQSIAYAATITPNGALGERVIVGALTGNLTINAPSNPRTGGMLSFGFAQDATGGRTITWNAAFLKAADGAGTASQKGATAFLYDGVSWVQIGGALAWA